MKSREVCQVGGCYKLRSRDTKGALSNRWCAMHCSRRRRPKLIYHVLHSHRPDGMGYIRPDGYLIKSIHNIKVLTHRQVWEQVKGSIPYKHHIHHIDGDKLNNDISNLQCLAKSEHDNLHSRIRRATCAV